jgi:hypothetical protein
MSWHRLFKNVGRWVPAQRIGVISFIAPAIGNSEMREIGYFFEVFLVFTF